MRLEELDYELPQELIAQEPIEPRDHARLLVLNRQTGEIHHRHFYELGDYLRAGDVLVINDTKVIRARLKGVRADTKGKVEVLLLRPDDDDPHLWHVLVKPGRRAKAGIALAFGGEGVSVTAQVEGRNPDGSFRLRFDRPRGELLTALDAIGEVPLPPYIKTKLTDDRPYQTVYAREPGSVAAPTAGLHFHRAPFGRTAIQRHSHRPHHSACRLVHLSSPSRSEIVEQHQIGEEFYRVPPEAAEVINAAWQRGNKVVAVGTTATRTLETVAVDFHRIVANEGWTGLFITVGHRFKAVDALITNFHLPRSSNLLLVAAFCGGMELVRKAYSEAIRLRYRFYSFGDAMLIL
jgi:S-adenosylmethionine:tRNA ribosyltransferase-isomerase